MTGFLLLWLKDKAHAHTQSYIVQASVSLQYWSTERGERQSTFIKNSWDDDQAFETVPCSSFSVPI